jgi:hypothetical protein
MRKDFVDDSRVGVRLRSKSNPYSASGIGSGLNSAQGQIDPSIELVLRFR